MGHAEKILALMADGIPRRAGEMTRAIGAAKMSALLATLVATGKLRRVSHGLYQWPSAESSDNAKTTAQPLRTQLLILIAALGQARSKDLTLLTGIGRHRNRGAGIANHMARLKTLGLIEASRTNGTHPTYRLSAGGLAFIRTLPRDCEIPDPANLRARLDVVQRAFTEEHSARMRRAEGGLGTVCAHIREALAQGPRSTTELIAARPDLFTSAATVHIALHVLEEAGEIEMIESGRGSRPSSWALRLVTLIPPLDTPEHMRDRDQ